MRFKLKVSHWILERSFGSVVSIHFLHAEGLGSIPQAVINFSLGLIIEDCFILVSEIHQIKIYTSNYDKDCYYPSNQKFR